MKARWRLKREILGVIAGFVLNENLPAPHHFFIHPCDPCVFGSVTTRRSDLKRVSPLSSMGFFSFFSRVYSSFSRPERA